MGTANDLILDQLGRVHEGVRSAVHGLSDDALAARPDPDANSVAWLVWHLTRIEDDHLAAAAGVEQAWVADGWADRFALPFDVHATGYGQSPQDVAAVRASDELLIGYHDAVYERSADYVGRLVDEDFSRVVDERWDPPVTLAVRLVSVLNDITQHLGQAAYARGIGERRDG